MLLTCAFRSLNRVFFFFSLLIQPCPCLLVKNFMTNISKLTNQGKRIKYDNRKPPTQLIHLWFAYGNFHSIYCPSFSILQVEIESSVSTEVFFAVYCHMGSFGCGGGGWTLVMKIDRHEGKLKISLMINLDYCKTILQ